MYKNCTNRCTQLIINNNNCNYTYIIITNSTKLCLKSIVERKTTALVVNQSELWIGGSSHSINSRSIV